MKPKKLKPGKCWGLVLNEKTAAEIMINGGDYIRLTFKTRKEAAEFSALFPAWERPRLVRLEVREV